MRMLLAHLNLLWSSPVPCGSTGLCIVASQNLAQTNVSNKGLLMLIKKAPASLLGVELDAGRSQKKILYLVVQVAHCASICFLGLTCLADCQAALLLYASYQVPCHHQHQATIAEIVQDQGKMHQSRCLASGYRQKWVASKVGWPCRPCFNYIYTKNPKLSKSNASRPWRCFQ